MRVGLIAMSGIRCRDEELLRLGLTLPGFVERSRTVASLPSLGLLTLAALTPAHHDVSYIEVPDVARHEVSPGAFDLVGISSYSAQIDEAYALADRYRAAGTTVVLGGPHVTALPGEALSRGDAVVVGEGEPCWSTVLEDAERGRLEEIYDGRAHGYDLADAPIPAFELLDIERYNRLTVQTSRGCPHHCEFCASSVLLTERFKQKPLANVIREIDRILEIWARPFLEFADDNAIVNRAYWKELLGEIADKRIRWFAETDLSVSEDADLLRRMRESGCAQVLIGFESPVKAGLSGLELRSDWKLGRFQTYRDAIHEIQSHGVTVNGCFVLGLDGQSTDIFDEVYEFVRTSGLYEVQITLLTPFPGTPLYERLRAEGRLVDPTDWRKCTLFDINYEPSGMSREELATGFRELAVKLYGEAFTHWRRDRFRQRYRRRTQGGGE